MGEPFLSVIIPAFNEEKRILPTLEKLQAYLGQQPFDSEIIVADDGSTDSTGEIVAGVSQRSPIPLRVLRLEHKGKGHAVRAGMLEASGEFRFMCDADLAMPVEQIARFLPPALGAIHVAIGSREAPGARRYEEPAYRHVMGRAFNLWVRLLTVRGIKDTQCGFKCFTAGAAMSLFAQQRLQGFGFDVEVLFLAQKGQLRVEEIPIDWYHQPESRVKPLRDTFRMSRDAALVRWNHLMGRYHMAPMREILGVEGSGSRGSNG
ncbi:MAG: putative glycosyltransferase [Dehalococcoidia bacterium]|nr:putative glycosyltransferase [Dehalococcoidia bacterium]